MRERQVLSMICDKAEPNTESKTQASIRPQEKVMTAKDQSDKKLISPDKLKKLSKIFNSKT